ncbi:MAG: hypothetical protein Q7T57_09440 [Dehalococcoidales bacterium]|nr:hypothetical protein [Dehalococcoidales bacterium]
MSKKPRKKKTRYNKGQSVRSIQPSEKIAQKPTAVEPLSSTKPPLPKNTAMTMKMMAEHNNVLPEIKRIAILAGIILLMIFILWLILR